MKKRWRQHGCEPISSLRATPFTGGGYEYKRVMLSEQQMTTGYICPDIKYLVRQHGRMLSFFAFP
ncbi:hypothetical protein [uncultured Megasphaera sp.]|uniref:hypothetical protein n=1 Tax=uncultured Megasphaera sp. TaxID=165188 RepID=UPI00260D8163|nr:hypothetical protein [uncultured Megasphaera sp.]